MAYVPEDGVMPPQTMTVDHERRPILYLPDGRVLVRQAGFRQEHDMAKTDSGKHPKGGGPKKH